jgi:hypothetical protein
MSTHEILKEINKLPVEDRLIIIEKAIETIRSLELDQQLSIATEEMADEYKINKELTVFTSLDLEDFYETR